ncbi:hypothetical protein CAL13_16535 [Bordetella genomosp. 9]|uniref:Uncharacterized protein n=1 Tax=Bordetella genomosp. 9 TaxID=1416803 RepID=A0A1W6Z2M2_9BORD|nr:hypothetical protein CAL13_16535 [Bordetella genomosp. 9]
MAGKECTAMRCAGTVRPFERWHTRIKVKSKTYAILLRDMEAGRAYARPVGGPGAVAVNGSAA